MIFREGGGVILGQFPLHPNIKTLYEAPAQIKSQSSNECFGLLIHKSSGGEVAMSRKIFLIFSDTPKMI